MIGIVAGVVVLAVVIGVAVVVIRGSAQTGGPTGSARYAHAANLCEVVDLAQVHQIHRWDTVEPGGGEAQDGRIGETASCHVFLSSEPSGGFVTGSLHLHVMIYDRVKVAKSRFDGDVDRLQQQVEAVEGPWHEAVRGLSNGETDPDSVLSGLWVLDGNLRLEISFNVDLTSGATEQQLAAANEQIAASVLAALEQP